MKKLIKILFVSILLISVFSEIIFADELTVIPATCSTEGKVISDNYETTIPKLEHKWEHYFNASTCNEEGIEYDYCTLCGEKRNIKNIVKLSHIESDWIIDIQPTCNSTGIRHKECTLCHEVLISEETPMLPHKHIVSEMIDNVIYYHCEDCQNFIEAEAKDQTSTENEQVIIEDLQNNTSTETQETQSVNNFQQPIEKSIQETNKKEKQEIKTNNKISNNKDNNKKAQINNSNNSTKKNFSKNKDEKLKIKEKNIFTTFFMIVELLIIGAFIGIIIFYKKHRLSYYQ